MYLLRSVNVFFFLSVYGKNSYYFLNINYYNLNFLKLIYV